MEAASRQRVQPVRRSKGEKACGCEEERNAVWEGSGAVPGTQPLPPSAVSPPTNLSPISPARL